MAAVAVMILRLVGLALSVPIYKGDSMEGIMVILLVSAHYKILLCLS